MDLLRIGHELRRVFGITDKNVGLLQLQCNCRILTHAMGRYLAQMIAEMVHINFYLFPDAQQVLNRCCHLDIFLCAHHFSLPKSITEELKANPPEIHTYIYITHCLGQKQMEKWFNKWATNKGQDMVNGNQ